MPGPKRYQRRGGRTYQERTDYGERIASLESEIKHLAPKSWVLSGVIVGILAGITLLLAILRTFGWGPSG